MDAWQNTKTEKDGNFRLKASGTFLIHLYKQTINLGTLGEIKSPQKVWNIF